MTEFIVECGRGWPGYRAGVLLPYEHRCVEEQGHDGAHRCLCGVRHDVDGADDDRVDESK